jgi:uncharacterized phage protein (TIGR02220 family)
MLDCEKCEYKAFFENHNKKKVKLSDSRIDNIIDEYNHIFNRNIRSSTQIFRKLIAKVLDLGYSMDDFKLVFEFKKAQNEINGNDFISNGWPSHYLKIDTLVRPGNFERYFNEAEQYKKIL